MYEDVYEIGREREHKHFPHHIQSLLYAWPSICQQHFDIEAIYIEREI